MSTSFDDAMITALEADGEYLRQMTGEDHGPLFLITCEACGGEGVFLKRVMVYATGCAFPHDDTDEQKCEFCDGYGTVLS
jgi:hypothetical protein